MMADAEIEAMSAVVTALADLDVDAQGRVLGWATERFGIALANQNGARRGGGLSGISGDTDEEDEKRVVEIEPQGCEHFADLFAATRPTNKQEKLLVAAYWCQKIEGQPSFQAYELNRHLKDLGHKVDHTSEALAAAMKKKPALVLQLRKSGNSQRARKTYKLSGEGVQAVEQMIRRS